MEIAHFTRPNRIWNRSVVDMASVASRDGAGRDGAGRAAAGGIPRRDVWHRPLDY